MKTIHELVTELSSLQNIEDKALPLLKSFLYSEHYTLQLCKDNEIDTSFTFVCEKCGNNTGKRSLSLSEMISKLINKNVLGEDSFKIFDLLNKLRNRLIHEISPNTQQVIKWIDEYKPPTNKALQEHLKQVNSWLRFYLCLIPAIADLYSRINGTNVRLESIEHNIPTDFWIFHFK